MDYFPMFVSLRGRRCLVVGGGAVAARKAALLLRAGAAVSVVAPELAPAFAEHVGAGVVAHRLGTYAHTDLEGVELVIAATDDPVVNAAVSADAQARCIHVNVVDQPALCTFIVPSIVDRAPLLVAVSTGGSSPVLARRIRTRIEAMLPARLGELARLSARLRDEVKAQLPSQADRRAFWERALDGSAARAALEGDVSGAEAGLRSLLHEGTREPGILHVIAASARDADLLSLRALHALQAAAVVMHVAGVAEGVLDLARRDAERESLLTDGAALEAQLRRHLIRVREGEHVCVLLLDDAKSHAVERVIETLANAEGIGVRFAPVAVPR